MGRLAKQYLGKVEFLVVYGEEPHPDLLQQLLSGKSLDRATREDLAQLLVTESQMTRRIVFDPPNEHSLERRFAMNPNSTIVIGVDRKVSLIMPWNDSTALAAFLPRFLEGGAVYQPRLAQEVPSRMPDMNSFDWLLSGKHRVDAGEETPAQVN